MATDYSNWMTNLPENLKTVPLKDLAIPGTHDSGSFSLDKKSDVSPSEPQALSDAVKSLEQAGPLWRAAGDHVKGLIYNWSATQDISLAEQFNRGVRYFDLRVAKRDPSDGSLYFVHGLYGGEVKTSLSEIARCLDDHPKEVVLLHFQQFYSLEQDDHERFIVVLTRVFGSKLCPKMDPKDATLAKLWEQGQQVIAFYQDDSAADNHPNLWPGDDIVSPWADTPDSATLIEFLDKKNEYDSSKFYVSQAILSPDAGTMIGHLFGNLKDTLATPAMPHIRDWLDGKTPGGVNIVIADFVDLPGFLPAVINLNLK